MKKKIILASVFVIIFSIIYGLYNNLHFGLPDLVSLGEEHNLIIQDISSQVISKDEAKVKINLTFDWKNLYADFDSKTLDTLNSLPIEERVKKRNELILQSLKEQISTDIVKTSLFPFTDETDKDIFGSPTILFDKLQNSKPTDKMAEYLSNIRLDKKPINFDSSNFSIVEDTNSSDLSSKDLDFVFLVGINHLQNADGATNGVILKKTVQDALINFTKYMFANSKGFKASIIEIGGIKATEKLDADNLSILSTKPDYASFSTRDGIILSKSNFKTTNSPSNDFLRKLILPNSEFLRQNLNSRFPQTVFYSDVAYNEYSKDYFLQGYTDWLKDEKALNEAIKLIGENNTYGTSLKSEGGTNLAWGLFESINFIKEQNKNNKKDSRKKVIAIISNQNFDISNNSLAFLPKEFSRDKNGFESWLKKELINNEIYLLISSPLSESDGETPYPKGAKDKLGRPVQDSWNGGVNSYYTSNLKKLNSVNISTYESSASHISGRQYLQAFLEENLFDFVSRNSLRQNFIITYNSPFQDTFDVWRKVVFSSENLKTKDGLILNTKTQLFKNKNYPEYSIYKGVNTLGINETFVDRYYFAQNPSVLRFANPSPLEVYPKWKPSKDGVYSLDFYIEKLISGKFTSTTKLNSLNIKIYDSLGKYVADAVPKFDKNSFIVNSLGQIPISISFPKENLDLIKNHLKTLFNKTLTFEVQWEIGNENKTDRISALTDFDGPEFENVKINNSTAKNILKELNIFTSPEDLNDLDLLTSVIKTNETLYTRSENNSFDNLEISYIIKDYSFENINLANLKLEITKHFSKLNPQSKISLENLVKTKVNNSYTIIPVKLTISLPNTNKDIEDFPLYLPLDDYSNTNESNFVFNIKALQRPQPINPSLKDSELISAKTYSNSNTKTYIRAFRDDLPTENYNLIFSNKNFSNDQVIALILPFERDLTNIDKGSAENFGISMGNGLFYTVEKSYKTNILSTPDYKTSIVYPFKKNNLHYDGLYKMNYLISVNRAGAFSLYENKTIETIKNLENLLVPITGFSYIVDSYAPTIKKSLKTALSFRDYFDPSKEYLKDVHFRLPYERVFIDETFPDIFYYKTIFSFKNAPGKEGDIFTLLLEDKNLPKQNVEIFFSPNFSKAPISTDNSIIADTLFHSFRVKGTKDILISTRDIAGNLGVNVGSIKVSKSPINPINYSDNVSFLDLDKTGNKEAFINSSSNVFSSNSFANAISYQINLGNISQGNLLDISEITQNVKLYSFKLYSFSPEGWVIQSNKNIVFDNTVYDTKGSSEISLVSRLILDRISASEFRGQIDLSNVFEFSGLKNVELLSTEKGGTFIKNNEKSIFTYASDHISSTGSKLIKDSAKLEDFILTYNGVVPSTDIIYVQLTDNLNNKKTFTINTVNSKNIKIIGSSAGENKVISSTVTTEKNKINIRSQKTTLLKEF